MANSTIPSYPSDTGSPKDLQPMPTRNATVLVVTSGKGGVGKTTSTASIGSALATLGMKTILIDFDVGLRNLDLILGAERRIVYNMIDVITGRAKLAQAIVQDKHSINLSLLPTSQTKDKDALTDDGVARIIESLRPHYDWIVCDSPAGIEHGALQAMRHADRALVVVNPEVSSVRDSDRIIGLLGAKTLRAEQGIELQKNLLVTRYDTRRARQHGDMLSISDIVEILAIPPIGIIPESEDILKSSNTGVPVPVRNPKSAAGLAYIEAARRLMGEHIPLVEPKPPSLFSRLMRE